MKPDAFLRAMGEIREDLVSDAETAGRTIPRWAKVSMAAVIVLCIAGALTMLLGQGVRPYGGQSLTSGSGVEEESSPENNFGISSEILEQAAPTVELTSRYGLTLQVSEELAGHFAVDVEDYVFPCPEEDGWADIAGGQDIIEHAAFVFSDPGNATGENGREGLIWCIQAIPAAEYTPVSNPDSEQDEPFMIYYINSRLLGRSEEYVYILVFPAPNWQYDPESLESLNAYWRHLYHGYEILQELAERYDWTDSMDWLDDYYERVVCLVDQERMKLTNQQTNSGVSDLDNDGLELAENVDNGVIELGGVRYKFYMAASPLFTPEYYEITVPSDFHVGEVVGYETDNTYDWYYAEVEPLSGWLIRYMRRNGDDKYSEGELYKAENITAIPQWIEDARKAIMENTGGYGQVKLDPIVDKFVRMKFEQIRTTPKESFISEQRAEEIRMCQETILRINKTINTKQAEIADYKAEIIKIIRGESQLTAELVNEMIAQAEDTIHKEQDRLYGEQSKIYELETTAKALEQEYAKIKSWADMYDQSSIAGKKMILAQFIKGVYVHRNYEIDIELTVSFAQLKSYARAGSSGGCNGPVADVVDF